jgi:hypothetical protein
MFSRPNNYLNDFRFTFYSHDSIFTADAPLSEVTVRSIIQMLRSPERFDAIAFVRIRTHERGISFEFFIGFGKGDES